MAKNKKNVEVNEFDETLAASKSFFEKNKKTILYGGGAILAIIIAALLVHQFYITPRNLKASETLAKAEQFFLTEDYDKALEGDGETCDGFLGVINQYGSTKAGNLARIYSGICYYQLGKFQEAIDMLTSYKDKGDAMISPSAIGMLGNCYAELGQNDKAAETLLKAANRAANNTLSPIYLIQAGQLFEALGQNDKALDCYNQIRTKYQKSPQFTEVKKYIERLN